MWEHFESKRDGTPRNIPFGICTTGLQKQESHDVNGTGISVVASEATNGHERSPKLQRAVTLKRPFIRVKLPLIFRSVVAAQSGWRQKTKMSK